MTLENMLKEKRQEIMALAARHSARHVGVFGTVATGEAGPRSDIDLLVTIDEDRNLLDVSSLTLELQDMLGVKKDVISGDSIH
jgi:hypothetical protein